ncbi:hypothetical protein SLS62_001806 [Diatrype stigma]|uniref:Uncharacterized protein n=1 Tax=Diatrype stigma TaxID=117547 RepID=A0AAN9YRG0_9PEZI
MVSLEVIRESNARIATSLPARLVAVFVGATSGIGETTLKQLVKRAQQPRIYFIGRRESEGRRIQAELKELNQEGEYNYLQYDVSLLKNVDEACRYLKSKEPAINLLFLSSGTLIIGRETDEALNYPMALVYYSRTRFIVNLLPQLRQASHLRRVVTVAAGGKEGEVFLTDLQARNMGGFTFRGHGTSMITLSLEAIATQAPEVSFVHVYPGFVKTGLSRELTGIGPAIAKIVFKPVMALLHIPIDETGERQIYFATSARFPPGDGGLGDANGVALAQGVNVAVRVDRNPGGGVYSIDYEGEGTSERVQALMKSLTEDGTADKIWKHTEEEFLRITGSLAAV